MKIHFRSTAFICAVFAGSMLFTGCVSQKTIETYEAQLKALEAKGVPDSLLSSVRVYISQAIGGKRTGNGMVVRTSIDSVKTGLAAAEQWYASTVQTSKPHVDSLLKYFNAKRSALSGLQLKEADSFLTIIASYTKTSDYFQARLFSDRFDTLLLTLLQDEALAKKAGAEISGTTWTMNKKHTEDGANAAEKSKVSFKKDGSFEMSEEMKGKTKPTLKEDWLFLTWGTYAMKGDTILLSTNREKRVRQNYEHVAGGKVVKKIQDKPYDSVISNGSKDRFFTFSYLKENFKR